MNNEIESIIQTILPNTEVKIIYVKTNQKEDITKYTDNIDLISEYNQLKTNNFYGMFIIPGTKKFFTIFINDSIKNTNQFYNTLTHELYHCLFFINNKHLIDMNNSLIGYKACDEFFARFYGYKISYEKKLYDDFIFTEKDNVVIENAVYNRIQKRKNWYEFISLFANIWFANKIRKLDVDIFRSFNCLDQQSLKSLIEIFEKIDFECLDFNIIYDIAQIIEKLF